MIYCGVWRVFKSCHRHFRDSKHAEPKCFSTRRLTQTMIYLHSASGLCWIVRARELVLLYKWVGWIWRGGGEVDVCEWTVDARMRESRSCEKHVPGGWQGVSKSISCLGESSSRESQPGAVDGEDLGHVLEGSRRLNGRDAGWHARGSSWRPPSPWIAVYDWAHFFASWVIPFKFKFCW